MLSEFTPILVILLLFCSSCIKNPQDESAPTLVLLSPLEDTDAVSGTDVTYELECRDDVLLDNLIIELDCPDSEYSELTELNLTGQFLELQSAIALPDSLFTGSCSVQIYCEDAEGRSSNIESFSIQVTNSIDGTPPSIMVTNPENCEEGIEGAASTSITLSGEIEDDHPIVSASFKIFDANDACFINTVYMPADTLFEFTEVLILPAIQGDYVLAIGAQDSLLNVSEKIIDLHVQ